MRIQSVFSLLFWLCLQTAFAAEASAIHPPRIEVPFAAKAPLLRAALDDPAWVNAAEIPALTLSPSIKAIVPPQKTSVRLLWDRGFLYVQFVCDDDDIFATLKGRDAEYHREDVVEVFLDPVGDEKQNIELQVSPLNGVRDVLYLCTGEPVSGGDGRQLRDLIERNIWTFVDWTLNGLKTATSRFDNAGRRGWVVELAIPADCLRRLGRKEFEPMTLRGNFIRLDRPVNPASPQERLFTSVNWSPVFGGQAHRSPAANGYLVLTGTESK